MSPVIHIQPVEAWGYYIKHLDRLEEELVEIANNEETNTSVYMTDEDGTPYLYVYRDDKKIFQSECPTVYSAERNLKTIYAKYLSPLRIVTGDATEDEDESYEDDIPTPDADDGVTTDLDDDDVPPLCDLDSMSDGDFKDMVNEREDEILIAVQALINTLTEDDAYGVEFGEKDDKSIDDIVNHIVEYLAIKCGLRIRRPMELVDEESGLTVRAEYPYEEYDFSEDELHN